MKPIIGISTYREVASWGVWEQSADLLHAEYADAIVRAGGVPVLLPPAAADSDTAIALVDRLDGLVIAGGADVDPGLYGEEPHPETANWRPDRDAWELALIRAANEAELPTLGICRGMQLMAVAGGGTLTQHTPDVVGHHEHSPGGPDFGATDIETLPGSQVAAAAPGGVIGPCHHHQSVDLHPGFEATAWAGDGTVEAMEAPGPRFCVAVQWHPEMHSHCPAATPGDPLFASLIQAAGAYQEAGGRTGSSRSDTRNR